MRRVLILIALLWAIEDCSIHAQVLTPQNFNLALGRKVEATSTCGVGVSRPEQFCKLTGANKDRFEDVIGDLEIIEGQLCDHCDPRDANANHSPEFAVDGTERWWQSPPLSRGLQYNEVNFTVHLDQVGEICLFYIKD